jgi:C-terminal processing protease CtpA/Prc
MQRIDNLIIDIRDNTGGMAFVPPFLYTYIGMKDFKFKEQLVFRHGYRFSNDEYLNRSKLNDWFNRKLMRKVNDTTYAWTLHNNTRKTYRVKKNSFKGQVYVLVNGMTASGAAEFATLVHHNKRGILVGEESGGDYNGINGYDRTYLQLPNSKIGVMIAGYRSVMPWDEIRFFGHGVPVDYTIHPDINDLVKGRDTELEFVYKLIRR